MINSILFYRISHSPIQNKYKVTRVFSEPFDNNKSYKRFVNDTIKQLNENDKDAIYISQTEACHILGYKINYDDCHNNRLIQNIENYYNREPYEQINDYYYNGSNNFNTE